MKLIGFTIEWISVQRNKSQVDKHQMLENRHIFEVSMFYSSEMEVSSMHYPCFCSMAEYMARSSLVTTSEQAIAGSAVSSDEVGNCSGPCGGSRGAKIPWDYDTAVPRDVVGVQPCPLQSRTENCTLYLLREGCGWMQTS